MSYRTDEDRRVDAFHACFKPATTVTPEEFKALEEALEEGIINRAAAKLRNTGKKALTAGINLGSRGKTVGQVMSGDVKGGIATQNKREARTAAQASQSASTEMLNTIDTKITKSIKNGLEDALKLSKGDERQIWSTLINDTELHAELNQHITNLINSITTKRDALIQQQQGQQPPPLPQQGQQPPPMPQQGQQPQ